MDFALTILGVNGATPAHGRFPTSQYLKIHNHHFLIDCGEGAQMRINDFGVPHSKIDRIFISHLHGDHIFGLPGLLFSFALSNRSKSLHIYSPDGLEPMIVALLMLGGQLPYPIFFHKVQTSKSELVFENKELTVYSVPLKHRIPTIGYLFREKPFHKNINPKKISEFGLSIPQIIAAKNGEDIYLADGRVINNADLTFPPFSPRSYAYISDTIFHKGIIPLIDKVDLLYHETTFCNDSKENANTTMHSTAEQAATIAKMANVGILITGHYSSRYKELDSLLSEAKAVFPNTVLGMEGKKYEVERKRENRV